MSDETRGDAQPTREPAGGVSQAGGVRGESEARRFGGMLRYLRVQGERSLREAADFFRMTTIQYGAIERGNAIPAPEDDPDYTTQADAPSDADVEYTVDPGSIRCRCGHRARAHDIRNHCTACDCSRYVADTPRMRAPRAEPS